MSSKKYIRINPMTAMNNVMDITQFSDLCKIRSIPQGASDQRRQSTRPPLESTGSVFGSPLRLNSVQFRAFLTGVHIRYLVGGGYGSSELDWEEGGK